MPSTALLIIDMQMEMAFTIDAGQGHACLGAEDRVADLLALFRDTRRPVLHVHHATPEPESAFFPGSAGAAPMACAMPLPGEGVFVKTTSSAFASTDLQSYLADHNLNRLVICGAEGAFCVNSTTRSASDLGLEVILAEDAVLGFDLPDRAGGVIPADKVLEVTFATLSGDFATLMPTATIVSELQAL